MKNKKILCLIAGVIVLILGIVITLIIVNNKQSKPTGNDEGSKEELKEEIIPEKPAANTEELKETLKIADVSKVTKDTLVFESDANVNIGDKVAVWVYSEPKFLGYFEVKLLNGEKVIEGLQAKLEELHLDAGNHNIAMATEKGESLGYINIVVEENGSLQEGEVDKTTKKEVVEKETIAFTTETKYDASKKSGSKEIKQTGVNGEKEIIYEVTYDENGTEISRTIIKENTIKEPVKQIVVIGKSDFNLNTDTVSAAATGFICSESQMTNGYCDDSIMLPQFSTVKVNGIYYARCLGDCSAIGFSSTIKLTTSGNGFTGKINGTTYYFDSRAGGGGEPLTEEICNQYGLSCGSW